MLAQTIKYI